MEPPDISHSSDNNNNNNEFRLYTVSKRDLIRTLIAFYKKVDETKIKNVERIADKYYMNQIALFTVLEKKFKGSRIQVQQKTVKTIFNELEKLI